MKRVLFFIILAVSFSLSFTQGKPCCKSKSAKGKVSCKIDQANIDLNNDGTISAEEIRVAEEKGIIYSKTATISNEKQCNGCPKNSPWWKFWAKKKDCCNTSA